ncbi:MAG: hypothetical protein Q9226_008165 [Calogaya cf. arnoldii]
MPSTDVGLQEASSTGKVNSILLRCRYGSLAASALKPALQENIEVSEVRTLLQRGVTMENYLENLRADAVELTVYEERELLQSYRIAEYEKMRATNAHCRPCYLKRAIEINELKIFSQSLKIDTRKAKKQEMWAAILSNIRSKMSPVDGPSSRELASGQHLSSKLDVPEASGKTDSLTMSLPEPVPWGNTTQPSLLSTSAPFRNLTQLGKPTSGSAGEEAPDYPFHPMVHELESQITQLEALIAMAEQEKKDSKMSNCELTPTYEALSGKIAELVDLQYDSAGVSDYMDEEVSLPSYAMGW